MALKPEDRAKLNSVIARMKAKNESEDDIRAMVGQFKAKYDTPSDTTQSPGATQHLEEDTRTPFEKFGLPGMIFPRTVESTERGGKFIDRALAGMGDVATLPQRAIAGAATLAGYRFGEGDVATKKGFDLAAQEMSRYKPDENAEGATRFAQEVAYDPTFVPGIAAGSTEAKLIKQAPKLLKAFVPGMSGAVQAGASTAVRQATDADIKPKDIATNAGIGAALPTILTGTALGTKSAAANTGKRLIQALIRPGQRGTQEGFDANYIMEDKEILNAAAGGIESLQSTLKKRFNDLSSTVKNIQQTSGKNVTVDVPSVYLRAVKKLHASEKFIGKKPELIEALADLQNNLSNKIEEFDEFTDLATAMSLRTNYGTRVNFQPSISGKGRQAAFDASTWEKVNDAFYKELSDEIKRVAPPEIKEIDNIYTKLIPVLKATNRRVLVETSNLPIGLMETVGGATLGAAGASLAGEGDLMDRVKRGAVGALTGALITKGLKSPRAGAVLYDLSKGISPPPAVLGASPTTVIINPEEEEKQRKAMDRMGQIKWR
jgi:hypothetical protein